MRKSEKVERYLFVRETSRYGCLYGDGGKWQDVNANGRIPARFLINFFVIITTVMQMPETHLLTLVKN